MPSRPAVLLPRRGRCNRFAARQLGPGAPEIFRRVDRCTLDERQTAPGLVEEYLKQDVAIGLLIHGHRAPPNRQWPGFDKTRALAIVPEAHVNREYKSACA